MANLFLDWRNNTERYHVRPTLDGMFAKKLTFDKILRNFVGNYCRHQQIFKVKDFQVQPLVISTKVQGLCPFQANLSRILEFYSIYSSFYKQNFLSISYARLKLVKNQAKAKQHPEAKPLLIENYLLSSYVIIQ